LEFYEQPQTSMDINQQVLYLLSGLGAINGFLVSSYLLFFALPKSLSNRLLGGLLFVLSIRIIKSVFFFFNPHLVQVFIQFGLSACSLIGPFLYFYVLSTRSEKSQLAGRWWIHVSFWTIIMSCLWVIYPYYPYRSYWVRPFGLIWLIYFQWFIYIVLAGVLLRKSLVSLFTNRQALPSKEKWVLNIYLGTVLIWLAYFTSSYTSYITGALSFSFVFYLSISLWIFNRNRSLVNKPKAVKYANKTISPKEAEVLTNRLQEIISGEELYKNPNLKLADVAKKLGTSPHRLSQFLNDNLGKNFSAYINQYRIEAAKLLLHQNHLYTLEAIGYECGFNSKSTFFTTFKKLTGTTPASFRQEVLKQ